MILLTRLLPLFLFAATIAPAHAEVYDKPLSVKKLRLRGDPQNPTLKHELTRHAYAGYTVKQIDYGEIGAERLSILPAAGAKARPCREAMEAGETELPAEMWSGYFAGVKSGYAFFTADDGVNGGMGFIVLRLSDQKKLFEDAYLGNLKSIEERDGLPLLRYQRVYSAKCSVITDGAGCAASIAHETGVTKESLAICAKGYRKAQDDLARDRCKAEGQSGVACIAKEAGIIKEQKWDASPTVVVYEVEADLHGTATGPTIKAQGNALSCYPAD